MSSLLYALKVRLKRKPEPVYLPANRSTSSLDIYIFCLFGGLVVGTVLANFCYASFVDEAGYYLGLLDRNVNLAKDEKLQLFGQVLSQRMMEVWLVWLVGLTACAVPLFCAFAVLFGFSIGFVMSVITIQKGLMGLPVFFMTVMPQSLCYLPIFAVLLFWGSQKGKKFRIPAFFMLLVLTAAGSALEAWINPVFLKLVL